MNALAKRWIVIVSIIVAVVAVVGTTVGILMNRPKNVVARSDRLETPIVRGVEKQDDKSLLSFSYVADAVGYRVTEYDETNNERHTQTYSKDEVVYAGEYVKADITNFLFATHTDEDFKTYKFTVLAKFSDQVFNSKESEVFSYTNEITLKTPEIKTINPKSTSVSWESIEYATSYDVFLEDEDDSNNDVCINTIEPYVTFDKIKQTFGEKSSYSIYVVAKNGSVLKQDFIHKSEKSKTALYIPTGKLESFGIAYNQDTKTISWIPVVGADVYNLYISTFGVESFANSKDNKDLFSSSASIISVNLDSISYTKYLGEVEIYVEAVSNNENITPSESNKISFVNKRQLAPASNIKLVSDSNYLQITWDPSTDARFVSEYNVIIYRYTEAQSLQDNLVLNPQNFNEVATSGRSSSVCELMVPLAINPEGLYGVAVQAKSIEGSQYTNSEFVYFKDSTTNKNLYSAKKILSSPDGILAVENADGTILVSWNVVENARRYYLKVLDMADNTVAELTVDDTREEFNRVGTRVPPTELTNLQPGKYKFAVRTASESSFYTSDPNDYNTSVSYPEGKDFASYKTYYDLSGFELEFDQDTKVLSWTDLSGVQSYQVFAGLDGEEPQFVAKVLTSNQYSLEEYFEDISHDTGKYKIVLVVDGNDLNFHLDTACDPVEFDFVQKYASPKALTVEKGENQNQRILKWTAGENANANTTFTVVVNGQNVASDSTSLDITPYLVLGENDISVFANEDETHRQSASSVVNNGTEVYNFVLEKIEGQIEVLATPNEYTIPTITLKFAPVKFANSYNVWINEQSQTNYVGVVENGFVLIQLEDSDVLKLEPFKTSTISIAPASTQQNVLMPKDENDDDDLQAITSTTTFKNNYYLPKVENVVLTTHSLSTNIISKIDNKQINIEFLPKTLLGDLDAENTPETKTITTYRLIIATTDPTPVVVKVVDFDIENTTSSVVENVFDLFVLNSNSNLLLSGSFCVALAAVDQQNGVVGEFEIDPTNQITITKELEDIKNIQYAETEAGMMLSFDAVFDATSYEVWYDETKVAEIDEQHADRIEVDLTSVFAGLLVGDYSVKIVAKMGTLQTEKTFVCKVEKKLVVGQIELSNNNTVLTIKQQELPKTLYKADGQYIYADRLMLVFDSLDAAKLKKTDSSQLSEYKTKLVEINNTAEDLVVSLSGFNGSQTCYVYAFDTTNKSSVSDYVVVDLMGVVRYSDPSINFDEQQSLATNTLNFDWNVEFVPFDDVMTAPKNYAISLKGLNGLVGFEKLDVFAYDNQGNELLNVVQLDLANACVEINKNNENYANLNRIKIVANVEAGAYTLTVQAKTLDQSYANDSNISQKQITFKKIISTPNVRMTQKTGAQNGDPITSVEGVDIDSEAFNLYFGSYLYNVEDHSNDFIAYDQIDGINLTAFEIEVVRSGEGNLNIASTNTISQNVYKLTSQNDYGYYFELNKQTLGINEDITPENPVWFVVKIKYTSPNSNLYEQSTAAYIITIQVSSCSKINQIENLEFFENLTNNTFGFVWDRPSGFNVNYTVSIHELGETTELYVLLNGNDEDVDSIEFEKSDSTISNYDANKIYVVEFSIELNNTTNTPVSQKVLLNNHQTKFEYDQEYHKLKVTFDNVYALEGVSQVLANGYVFTPESFGDNYVVFGDAENMIQSLRKTLDADRNVEFVVYEGNSVVYDGVLSAFPVVIEPYADGVEVVNDQLYWNTVEYASSYNVFDANTSTILNSQPLNTNFAGLASLFSAGGQYDVYVEVVADETNNVFKKSGTYQPQSIVYYKPFDSVTNVVYDDTTYDPTTQKLKKTISFRVGADAPQDANKKFVLTVGGTQNLQIVATQNGEDGTLVFEENDGVYTIDLSQKFNNLEVGEYVVSVSVYSTNDEDVYRTGSRNTTKFVKNRKIVSVPTQELFELFDIIPDMFVDSMDSNTKIAISNDDELKNFVEHFNQKTFKLKTPFETAYAMTLKLVPHQDEAEQNSVFIRNIQNETSSTYLVVDGLAYDVELCVFVENDDYYFIPTFDYGQDIQVLTQNTGFKRVYHNIQFLYAEQTPVFEILTTTPQEGQSGANEVLIQIQNATAGTYILKFYDNETDFDVLDNTNQNTIEVELQDGQNQINLGELLGKNYAHRFVSISKFHEGIEQNYLSSFFSLPKEFDYCYVLGDITEVLPQVNGKLMFEVLDVLDATQVLYHLTLKDTQSNFKTYEILVEYAGGVYELSENNSAETKSLAQIFVENDKTYLSFDITKFASDTQRNNFYLVGDFEYSIFASDNFANLEPQEVSENNIKSSNLLEGDYYYTVVYPLNDFGASIDGNVLSWSFVDTSGLKDENGLPINLNDCWQLSLDATAQEPVWFELKDVVRTVDENTNLVSCSTQIMLSYTEREQYKNTMRIRLVPPVSDFVEDTEGFGLQEVLTPKLANVLATSVENARTLKLEFDFAKINRSTQNRAYYLDDLNTKLEPQISIGILFNEAKADEANLEVVVLGDEVVSAYKNRQTTIDLLAVLSPQQKQQIVSTKNGVSELKNGTYKFSVVLKNGKNTEQTTYYQQSDASVFETSVVARWDVANVMLNKDAQSNNKDLFITYFGDITSTDKGLNTNKAIQWANGTRTTILTFDVQNPLDSQTQFVVYAGVVAYNSYVANNNIISCNNYQVFDPIITQAEGKWNVRVDISSIWANASLPKEYFVVFYVGSVKTDDTVLRRESVVSTHSDQNTTLQQRFEKSNSRDRVYTILNYKNLPTFSLADSFVITNEDKYAVLWIFENQSTIDKFAFDLDITEVEWNAGTNAWLDVAGGQSASKKSVDSAPYLLEKLISSPKNEKFYKTTLTLSETTDDSYYLGNNAQNGGSTSVSKVYQYLDFFEKPTNISITSSHDSVVDTLKTTKDFDNPLTNEEEDLNIVVVDEDSQDTKTIKFNFKQPSASALSYKLLIVGLDNNFANVLYVGKNPSYVANDLYVYFSDQECTTPYNQTDEQNASRFYIDPSKKIGLIENGNVVVDGLDINTLFGVRKNIGSDYKVQISAFIPVYAKMQSNFGAGITSDINSHNQVAETYLRYYIKFKTPDVNVSITGDVKTENGKVYIKNMDGNYRFNLDFEVSNMGESNLKKNIAIFVKDHYNISQAYITDYASNYTNNTKTFSVEIRDTNNGLYSGFKNLVNTMLPANLTFFAIVLPYQQNWTSYINGENAAASVSAELSYNETNNYISNKTINSIIQSAGASKDVGIQLPIVPAMLFANNIIEQTQPINLQPFKNNKNLLDIKSFGVEEDVSTGVVLAVDPYLGFDNTVSKTREYLYADDGAFAKQNYFVFSLYIKDELISQTLTLKDVLDIKRNTKTTTYPTTPKTNLYDLLKQKYPTGGKAELKLELKNNKVDDTDYLTSDTCVLNFDFYVRDETEYQLEIQDFEYNPNHVEYVKYAYQQENQEKLLVKSNDLIRPTAKASVLKQDSTNNIEGNIVVGLSYNCGSTPQTRYYFTSSTNDIDVMKWLLDVYYTDNAEFELAYAAQKGWATAVYNTNQNKGFVVDALKSNAQWEIVFTLIKTLDDENSFTTSNYVGNKKSFVPELKLANNSTYTPKTITGGHEEKTFVERTKTLVNGYEQEIENIQKYVSQYTLNTWPDLKNINKTAKKLFFSLDETNFESIDLTSSSDIYGLTATTLANDVAGSLAVKIEELIKGQNFEPGNYEIYYKFGYVNDNILESDVKSFVYNYYQFESVDFEIYRVVNGVWSDSTYKISESADIDSTDGLLVITTKAIETPIGFDKLWKVYFKNADNQYDQFKNRTQCGVFEDKPYMFISFDPSHADCLNTGESDENKRFLQAGINYNILVAPNEIMAVNSNLSGALLTIFGSAVVGDASQNRTITQFCDKTLDGDNKLKLPSDKYLTLSINKDDIRYQTLEVDNCDEFDNIVENSEKSTQPLYTQLCPTCEGHGFAEVVHDHHKYVFDFICIKENKKIEHILSNYDEYKNFKFNSNSTYSQSVLYKCEYCGLRMGRSVSKGRITKDMLSTIETGGPCKHFGTCPDCGGTGHTTSAKYTIPAALNTGSNQILDWTYLTDEHGNEKVILNDENKVIGAKIQVLAAQGNKLYAYNTELKLGEYMYEFDLYSSYPISLEISGGEPKDPTPYTDAEGNTKFKYTVSIGDVQGDFVCRLQASGDCFIGLEPTDANTVTINKNYTEVKTKEYLIVQSNFTASSELVVKEGDAEPVDTPVGAVFVGGDGDRGGSKSWASASFRVKNDTAFDIGFVLIPDLVANFKSSTFGDGSISITPQNMQSAIIAKNSEGSIEVKNEQSGSVGEWLNQDHFDSITGTATLYACYSVGNVNGIVSTGCVEIAKISKSE